MKKREESVNNRFFFCYKMFIIVYKSFSFLSATTASQKLNGVEEGMKAYDGVVKLLLDYYDGVLYGDVLVTVDAE